MRDRLRHATPEEIESIFAKADLNPSCEVLALDTPKGPILSVLRMAPEVDPIQYPEGCEDRFKLINQRDIETFLLARQVPHYYFNILDSDVKWQEIAKKFGAEEISLAPERRFKKVL